MTKPRGNKRAKILYNKSGQGHLRSKKSTRTKNRILSSHKLSDADEKKVFKMIET
jgi:ribosomal protein L35